MKQFSKVFSAIICKLWILNDYQCWVVLTKKVGPGASYQVDSLNENWLSKNYPRYDKDHVLTSRAVMGWTIGFRSLFSRIFFGAIIYKSWLVHYY
jgi:hypothetical protein